MTSQAKILDFLDVAGTWDPSLAFVICGALCVTFPAFAWAQGNGRAPCKADCKFEKPAKSDIDPSLLIGSAAFGVGWGLCGICPGPAMAGVVPYILEGTGLVFVVFVACLGGAWLATDAILAGLAANSASSVEIQKLLP